MEDGTNDATKLVNDFVLGLFPEDNPQACQLDLMTRYGDFLFSIYIFIPYTSVSVSICMPPHNQHTSPSL